MKKRSIWITVIAVLLVIVLVGVAGIVYAQHVASTANPPHKATGAIQVTPTPLSTEAAGNLTTYKIVPQTTASYSVYEDLIFQNKPNNDAIGKTDSVTGQFAISTGNNPTVTNMTLQIDLRTLKSDSSMRDGHVQDSLETDKYPYATFVSVSTQGLPASYSDGQSVNFNLLGNLTLHGKTNGETFAVQGTVSGKTITGTATTTIYMSDFGVQPPSLSGLVTVQDKTVLSLDFTAQA